MIENQNWCTLTKKYEKMQIGLNQMELHTKILELRKKGGMTQQAMADSLNVSRQTISKWETGAVLPDVDNLSRIANTFQVSVDYLLDVGSDKIVEDEAKTLGSHQDHSTEDIPSKNTISKQRKTKPFVFVAVLSCFAIFLYHSPIVASVYILFLIGILTFSSLIGFILKPKRNRKEKKK